MVVGSSSWFENNRPNTQKQTHRHTADRLHCLDNKVVDKNGASLSWVSKQTVWNKYVSRPYGRAEMYAGRVACCPMASHGQYTDVTCRQTDRRTDANRYIMLSARRGQRNTFIETSVTSKCTAKFAVISRRVKRKALTGKSVRWPWKLEWTAVYRWQRSLACCRVQYVPDGPLLHLLMSFCAAAAAAVASGIVTAKCR